MTVKNLLDPILEQGIKNTNYFEGRLLAGQDLREQQEANRQHDRYLGQAIGQGIINGLEVALDDGHDGSDGNPPVVTVKKGLAINANGDTIGLPDNDIKLALSRSIDAPKIELAEFYVCAGAPGHQYIPNGVGIYILVMSPTAGYKEKALKSGLGDDGVAKGCGSRYIQEGVKFRLIEFIPSQLNSVSEETRGVLNDNLLNQNDPALKDDLERLSMLRNLLAHICFGTEQLNVFSTNLYTHQEGGAAHINHDAIQELYALDVLSGCDVPLALFYWTLDGIAFLDGWSVRRGLTAPLSTYTWPSIYEHRRRAISEAMFYQFQDHLAMILDKVSDPETVVAQDYFRFLPPSGFVPLKYKTIAGFSPDRVFEVVPHRSVPEFSNSWQEFRQGSPQFIDGGRLSGVFRQALNYPVVDLHKNEMVWLYFIWQQIAALEAGSVSNISLVFTSSQLQGLSVNRFDVDRWEYANYASCCSMTNSNGSI